MVDPHTLPDALAAQLVRMEVPGTALRVAVDGPPAAGPSGFAESLVVPIRALGRPAVLIRADTFWRDAALRLENGRTDLASFATGWLDAGALRREVLDPVGPAGHGRFIPSLRDPVSNRMTREPARAAQPGSILLISGELLLGRGLPFDHTIHLALSPAARRRRTPEQWQWTLPAFDDYDATVDPVGQADVALRYDDSEHPAIRVDPALA
ncbi:MAG: uridine kinase [Geodermatophilaceae bacterium]|nr:uridine kinase [Geodermatophilaceae bacterium]